MKMIQQGFSSSMYHYVMNGIAKKTNIHHCYMNVKFSISVNVCINGEGVEKNIFLFLHQS